ncbi:MAG TPA: TIGR01212 family radical SAM protein [Deltaproteobacteria bacterium]|nr:TIGR01212 family radical SAM protein [Deltaproteobacteria bacterium]
MTQPLYRTLNAFLRQRYGKRVQKITLDAGLTCPHRVSAGRGGCVYCNDKGSGTGAFSRGMSLDDQIETQMKAAVRKYHCEAFIAYFQSYSNTHAPVEHLKALYDHILPYPEIVGLSIGTRPDCIDEEKLTLIKSYAKDRLTCIEYGLQSASDETLERINRGHTVQTFIDAVHLTARYPIRQCAHVIIGLPGEGVDQYLQTARLISHLPITDIKIHLLYVIRSTPLESLYLNGAYQPLALEEYARAVALFISYLREDIVIQRITGDPHPEELVAPLWAREKHRVRERIHQSLVELDLRQGTNYRGT